VDRVQAEKAVALVVIPFDLRVSNPITACHMADGENALYGYLMPEIVDLYLCIMCLPCKDQ
jgi:hypothetical protein